MPLERSKRECPKCGGHNLDTKKETKRYIIFECRNMDCELFDKNRGDEGEKPVYDKNVGDFYCGK